MNDHSGPEPVPVLAHTCLLGESPVWDIERQSICWVDIQKGEWHEYSPQHHIHIQSAVQQMLGAIGLCTNGNLIAALQHGFGFIDRATRQLNGDRP